MRIESVELHFLEIPFRISFSHGARADRVFSDSIVLRVGGGGRAGWGEAVVREYVSGSLGSGETLQQEVARIASGFLAPLRDRDLSWAAAAAILAGLPCPPSALPILCAVESALLAYAVEESEADPYAVLGMRPARTTVVYGGILPLVPLEGAKKYLDLCTGMGLSNLKVKVGADAAHNTAILDLCRSTLGADFDIRVDANSAWGAGDVDAQLEICARYGVRVIEQPFPAAEDSLSALIGGRNGFSVMADEGVLTLADVCELASSGRAQILNLRLSKNGGLSRLLGLAAEAEKRGLSYQLGCMVGETGILSCLGRLAASLLPRPLYVEGSYDDLLLEGNVVTPSFAFGRGGEAPILQGPGMGYHIDERNLARFSRARVSV